MEELKCLEYIFILTLKLLLLTLIIQQLKLSLILKL